MSLKKYREAGLTKLQPDGNETFYVKDAEPDPDGKRCYCVVTQDMRLNEIVVMTPQEMTLIKIKFGDQMIIEDWTEIFNIHPKTLEKIPDGIYGKRYDVSVTFNELMQYDTQEHI
jgi:hypothetical protein